jgi:hypothetical protein
MRHDEPMAVLKGDEGAILLIVLFVTTVLAIIIGVVLTNVEVNLRNTGVAQNIANKTYAADGGVEYVIQRLREDPTSCGDPNLSPWQQNNVTVTVSCTPVAGPASFGSGWAVITTDISTSGSFPPDIHGPAYVAGGLSLAQDLIVGGGPVIQANPCSKTGSGNVLPATSFVCTAVPLTGAQPQLPCLASCAPGTLYDLPSRGPDPSYITASGTCSIFLPGKYTGAPNLGARNYFASGIYYFENADINVNGIDVFGGKKGASETVQVDQASACAGDSDAGVSDGSGVEWILGGTSAVSIGSALNTHVELFARRPAGSASEGSAGISIRSVPATAPAGYTPSSASTLFSDPNGANTQVAVHGLVYAPDAGVIVSSTKARGSELGGGVVASTLSLRKDFVVAGSVGIVSAAPPPDLHQFFTISSTALGGTTKDVNTTAVIELGNDTNRSVVIDSWVTNAA